MKAIYIVKGSTGEWEDYHTWAVAAYEDHNKAEIHRVLAQEAADAMVAKDHYGTEPTRYDLNFHCYYNGVRYHIEEVLMVSELTDDGLFAGVNLLNKHKKGTEGRVAAAVTEQEPVAGSFADKLRKAVKTEKEPEGSFT